MDSRVLTWRIPNDPSPKTKQHQTNKRKISISKPVNNENSDQNNISNNNKADDNIVKKAIVFKEETVEIQSPISSPTPNKKESNDNVIIENNNARIQSRLWKSFFATVTRSIDELYYVCEEEGDEQKVQEAVELFERSVHDFVKLIERIQEQRRFSLDQTTAISWEVRKPTVSRSTKTFSPGSPNALQLMSAIKASPQSTSKANNEDSNIKQESSLESTTKPATNSKSKMNLVLDCSDNEKANINSKLRAAAPAFLPSNKSNDERPEVSSMAPVSSIITLNVTAGNENKFISSSDKNNKENNHSNAKVKKTSDNQMVSSNNSAFTSIDNWDAEAEAEVVLASEKIWAEAEAWIEAEAAVEEAAWEVLGFDDDRSKPSTPIQNTTNRQSVIDFSYSEKDISDTGSLNHSNYNSDNENDNESSVSTRNDVHKSYRDKTPISLSAQNSNNSTYYTPDYSSDENASKSPSQQNFNLTPTSRSLHDKLSSPCRRRSLTPVEAKLKAEARQLAAEAHRGGIVQERIEKAKLTWSRIKMRGEKEAQRLVQLEHALEDRLKEAEKRHEEYIKNIKGKAGNENAKVSEVMFINSLNSDMVAEHLQQKFEEVEARVLAAAQRRQERLDAISNQKMRRNSRKTVQMSELRLRLEQIKMERWSNLQKRLETVNQRRLSRLAEMKRRSDEESSKPTLLSPSNEKGSSESIETAHSVDTKESNKFPTIFEDLDETVQENDKSHVLEAAVENLPSKVKANTVTKSATNSSSSNQRVLLWNFWKIWFAQIKKKGTANSRSAAIAKQWDEICQSLYNRQEVSTKSMVTSFISEMLNDAIVWIENTNANEKNTQQSKKKKSVKNHATFISQNVEKFNNILSTIYKLKNEKDLILEFTSSDGLLFLRIFLGSELGLLKSEENLNAGVTSNLWPNLGRLLSEICGSALGRDKLLYSGLGVLISDFTHISLLHILSWRESKFQPIDTDDYFRTNDTSTISNVDNKKKKKSSAGKKSIALVESESLNTVEDGIVNKSRVKSTNNNSHDINKSWPQEFLILPNLLTAAMLLFRHIPNDDVSEYQDKLVWYFFASGTLNLICRSLVDLQQLTNEVTELDLPYTYAHSMLGLISALASFLRLSAGVSPYTMLTSISCLSSKQHKHPRGREMVSLLRSADMIPSMISLLGSFILSKRNTSTFELTAPVYALNLTILQSLIELATVDLSLLQELPQDSQVSIIHCASRLMQALLVTQNRSDSDDYTYSLSPANVISIDGFIRNPQSNVDSLKNSEKQSTINFSVVEADLCLDRLFSFLGLICLRSPCMQAVISRGTTPTLLIELCRLPIKYFTEERLKRQLLPCLISICLDSPDNLNVLKIELSCSILSSFLKDSQRQLLDFEDKKYDDKKVSTYLCQLSHRLPLDLWEIAIKTFDEQKVQKRISNSKSDSNFHKALLSVD